MHWASKGRGVRGRPLPGSDRAPAGGPTGPGWEARLPPCGLQVHLGLRQCLPSLSLSFPQSPSYLHPHPVGCPDGHHVSGAPGGQTGVGAHASSHSFSMLNPSQGPLSPCYRGGPRGPEGAHASLELTLAWVQQSQDTPSGLGSDVCMPHRLPGLRCGDLVLCDQQPPSRRSLTRRESMCLQGLAHSCVITPCWKRLRCTPAGVCADSLWHIPTNIPVLPQTAGALDACCTADGPWERHGGGRKPPDTQTARCAIPGCRKSRRGECTRPSIGKWSEVGVGVHSKVQGARWGLRAPKPAV